MGKPRCEDCNKAMKRPHERVGAKGNWISIKQWWYCTNCQKMEKSIYQIPTEVEKYLDDLMGKKYPIIAKIREETNAPFFSIQELESVLETRSQKTPVSGFPIIQDKLKAYWHCEICQFSTPVELGIISGLIEDEIFEKQIPIHCGNQMKISIARAALQEDHQIRLKLFHDAIRDNDLQNAGDIFLESFLKKFAYLDTKNAMEFYIQISRIEIPLFSETFGFKATTLIIEAYIPEATKFVEEYNQLTFFLFSLIQIRKRFINCKVFSRTFKFTLVFETPICYLNIGEFLGCSKCLQRNGTSFIYSRLYLRSLKKHYQTLIIDCNKK
ncbi:MAG: hypothetical protein GPJ54_16395 [Candidatus Heimdallarchaeota archaeon]|nr:hypothetical protein [Candidatus Heimdallarchaeota archaeon]